MGEPSGGSCIPAQLVPRKYGFPSFLPQVTAEFRQGRSAVDNVIAAASSAQHARSECQHPAGVFPDTMKAYDNFFHSAVVTKLEQEGLEGRVPLCEQDSLSGKSTFVSTTEENNRSFPAQRGVPQDSVLSPLLLNFFMASLRAHHRGSINTIPYADDLWPWTSRTHRYAIQRRRLKGLHAVTLYLFDWRLSSHYPKRWPWHLHPLRFTSPLNRPHTRW